MSQVATESVWEQVLEGQELEEVYSSLNPQNLPTGDPIEQTAFGLRGIPVTKKEVITLLIVATSSADTIQYKAEVQLGFGTFHKAQASPQQRMDQFQSVLEPARQFAKDSIRLVKRCTKPDRKEYQKIAFATAIGFAIMGFIGFFVKLIHIPINNIIVGA
ncbi:hypothetical protein WR25_07555 [Diploscapter pachys]|uniref:Protein transport protein Sec61 subunit gamma n=2 Tax=Diploscapter pachys TaxID=2018661 RepID=A0A2A2JRV8_9BILA|nr:hypothetical protein WR25_07555 [Diploscapter pachys]